MSLRRPVPVIAAALVVAILASGCLTSTSAHQKQATPGGAVSAYLSDWSRQEWPEMRSLVSHPPADFVSVNAGAFADLAVSHATFTAGTISAKGTKATVPVTEALAVRALGTWRAHTTLRLVERAGRWRVLWSPETINPALGPGDRFSLTYVWPARAAILGAGGAVLGNEQPAAVTIGLRGHYIKHPASLATALIAAGAPSQAVRAAIAAAEADPTVFEPVFKVSMTRYEQLKPTLYPLPGTFFQTSGGGSATDPYLADVIGQLGTITASQLRKLGPPYTTSTLVGQSGLQALYQRQLAGTPGGTVAVTGPAPSASAGGSGASSTSTSAAGTATSKSTSGSTTSTTSAGAAPAGRTVVLWSVPPKPGHDVKTSIVPRIEKEAGAALAGESLAAGLVAINTKTDQVVAIANNTATGGLDLALDGEQPPGSTFKIITSTAFILRGLSPSSAATCPPTIDVDGEILHNAGNEPPLSNLLEAFTVSCNTAFIGLTMANLNNSSLHRAASIYGLGEGPLLGGAAFGGSVPIDNGQTDLAASAIGQGQVVVSPLDLAMVTADVDSGTVRSPSLVPGTPGEGTVKRVLPHNLVADLHEMMLSVVEHGTAAGTGLPPGTYAKTGTAEYGSGNPLPLDAWLAGFNGHIAFAMVVINSPDDGGPTDGPIVAQFLRSIGSTG